MNETLKSILRILEEGRTELQVAAAQILGELKAGDPQVIRALGQKLTQSETFLVPFVVDALSQIGGAAAVEVLVQRLAGGGSLTDRIMQALSLMGAPAARELSRSFDQFPDDVRIRILEILGRNHDKDGLAVLCRTVFAPHPPLAQAAADVLRQHAVELTEPQRALAIEHLEKRLNGKAAVPAAPDAQAFALTVIAELDPGGARGLLLKSTSEKFPAIVRQAALRGLAGTAMTPHQYEGLLELMQDMDMTHVVRPVMHLLESVEKWSPPAVVRLKKMLQDEREEVRLFALRSLRQVKTANMAQIAFEHLQGSEPSFAEVAGQLLGENPEAVDLLLTALLAERRADRAMIYARPLKGLKTAFDKKRIAALGDRFLKVHGTNEAMAEVVLSVLLEVAPKAGAELVVDRAIKLRKARKLADAIALLLRLAQSSNLDLEGRFQLAVARLLMDGLEGRTTRSSGDATMGHFAVLVRDGFPVRERLEQEAQLSAEALLRLGTHFAGSVGAERRFGADLLRFVAEKHKRAAAGEEARQLLRAEGF